MNPEPALRVLVIGHVEWTDAALVRQDLDALAKSQPRVFRLFTREPRGAEAFAALYAREHGWSHEGAMTHHDTTTTALTPLARATRVVHALKPNYVFVYLTADKPSRDTLAMLRAANSYARQAGTQTRLLSSRRVAGPPPARPAAPAAP